MELGTILGIWAHPDDETYLSAGLMAAASAAGSRVVCVTATRGEQGSWDEERWPTATLGAVREQELLRSLAIMGDIEHHWLDYPDGGCAGADQNEAVGKVTALVEDVQPDAILSFGPEGMTGHPDHKRTCAWATAAFEKAGKAGSALYYATTTPEWKDRFYDNLQRFNVYYEEGTPPVTPAAECAIRYVLPPEMLERKLQAIQCHESQVQGMVNAFGEDFFREALATEDYYLGGRR